VYYTCTCTLRNHLPVTCTREIHVHKRLYCRLTHTKCCMQNVVLYNYRTCKCAPDHTPLCIIPTRGGPKLETKPLFATFFSATCTYFDHRHPHHWLRLPSFNEPPRCCCCAATPDNINCHQQSLNRTTLYLCQSTGTYPS
jgi:hypothetical protein